MASVSCVSIGLAYRQPDNISLAVAACIVFVSGALFAVFGSRCGVSRLRLMDWAILLISLDEAVLFFVSPHSPSGLFSAKTTILASLLYFYVRSSGIALNQCLIVSSLVGFGGIPLAWFGITQFHEHFQELQAAGLSDAVAFRYRLISPPSPWVLGEWFTLVLMTVPFAFAIGVFLWLTGRRKLAAVSLLPTSAITAALALSCSRAVFWGVAVFFVSVFAVGTVYRVFSIRVAGIGTVGTMCALAVLAFAENALYPGVLEAYTGRHTSQVRSTEGRLAIWKRSVVVFKLSPFWGVGSGNAPLFLAASADEDQTTGFASRTFSLPVQVFTEKGIVGAALYMAVLVLAGWEAHRKLHSPKVSPQMKGLTCCLVAGVAAVLFRELTYSSLLEHAATVMLFTMSLALLVGEPA